MTDSALFKRITPTAYRVALSAIPTSVMVVSSMLNDQPVGMVIGTFSAVSMDPPLVGFFGDSRSQTLEPLLRSEMLTFSLLRQDDLAICEAFQRPLENRFDGIDWRISAHGTPELPNTLLTIHSRVHAISRAGDHKSVIAEVIDFDRHSGHGRPLVFFRHRLSRLDPGQVLQDEMWQLGWQE